MQLKVDTKYHLSRIVFNIKLILTLIKNIGKKPLVDTDVLKYNMVEFDNMHLPINIIDNTYIIDKLRLEKVKKLEKEYFALKRSDDSDGFFSMTKQYERNQFLMKKILEEIVRIEDLIYNGRNCRVVNPNDGISL